MELQDWKLWLWCGEIDTFELTSMRHKCVVYTAHSPVKSLMKTKHPSGKLARWGEVVSEFDLEVKYRPGRKNSNADALARSQSVSLSWRMMTKPFILCEWKLLFLM